MEKTKLRSLLEELHGELENAESVEPAARGLLRNVMDDIHGVLDGASEDTLERSDSRSSEEKKSVNDQLNRAIVEFETSHPQVSFAVERLMKSLADIGI